MVLRYVLYRTPATQLSPEWWHAQSCHHYSLHQNHQQPSSNNQ
nr:hypothetical protein [uncultured Arsenicibacter sp.]